MLKPARVNEITHGVIGAAIEVHRELGPSLLESAYEHCLGTELQSRGLTIEKQKALPVSYKGDMLEYQYRIDLVVEGCVVVEVKSVERLIPVHEAQILTYMRLLQCPVGLLINFNVPQLIQGVKRYIIDVTKVPVQH